MPGDLLSSTSLSKPPFLRVSAAMLCLLGLPVMAQAAYVPPNLAPGSSYRLIFVTADIINGTSGDEATYNEFVNTEAAQNPDLPTATWTAITSTEGTSALGNIDTVCDTACQSAPIYLVDGTTLVANGQAALFNEVLNAAIYETQTGGQPPNPYVWTGSTSTGETKTGYALGDSSAEVGNPSFRFNSSSNNYSYAFDIGFPFGASSSLPVYAISDALTVPSPVPEPGTGLLLLSGLAGTGLVLRLRRGNRQAARSMPALSGRG